MKAVLLLQQRVPIARDVFKEIVVWRLPRKLPGSQHGYKYRLALIASGACVLRYDNEAGKGDHRHLNDAETHYEFITIEQLLEDFDANVARYLHGHADHR